MNRRNSLVAGSIAGAALLGAEHFGTSLLAADGPENLKANIRLEDSPMAFTVPPLPYPFDALEPYIDAKTMEKILFSLGFRKSRQKGSHAFYGHVDGRTTTIPHHPGRDLSRPLIRHILREIEIQPQDFEKALRSF